MAIDEIKKICVVGAGTMGHQIALQCATHNYDVHLVDATKEILDNAQEKIRKVLEKRVSRGEIPSDSMGKTLSKISYTTDLEKVAMDADFVIEAVYEDLEAKRQVFSQLDRICSSHTILATNSSSIRCSLIAEATKRPEKVLNMHFLNPVWIRPLVEVMGSSSTSEESIETTVQLGQRIGLTPVTVTGEVTGYVFNRLWRAIKKAALYLVDKGYASFEDVDRAFMIGIPAPFGPFMGMDTVGLDVILAIEEQWYRESGDESDKPPKILVEKVKKGELGVKTGKGFYQYSNPSFKRHGWLKREPQKTP
ncbi:MAG: 3-hydroxyacyl-CoA dehydrogenase family protein [Candidatus Bathyarchaeota archaeon]|nr:3-hydroxyacyl-CoA dehydrogenase family protein [Candidatus Bathyarchaeota archaeon]MDH5419398.1 3-hydroxyacyl-CoA dehydrogenase family protein [Candidatus Bathyarchaeota archaeon]MDH5701354.1 3-hydroxyacyl-CoA dehydrogenase family protein [Candidatus Bathyarchaeota archaeon]